MDLCTHVIPFIGCIVGDIGYMGLFRTQEKYRDYLLDLLEMNESNKPNINQLIEKKGEGQVALAIASSKTKEELQAAVIHIMKEGEKEFVKENKRTMTYLELRSIYG